MDIRCRSLPPGWYPGNRDEIIQAIAGWKAAGPVVSSAAIAAIAPHAGWYFSGRLAWAAWQAANEADTVIILGGHRSAGTRLLVSMHDAFDTPLGPIEADDETRSMLFDGLATEADRQVDNTLEVHLPFAAYRFPGVRAVLARVPNDASAVAFGRRLADIAAGSTRRFYVLGSTDLTHYGPSYGFEPGGSGAEGKAWATVADESIIKAFMDFDDDRALKAANRGAACSVGAALAAMSYAKARGAKNAELLGRFSSDEIMSSSSFVGYCAIAYRQTRVPGVQ
ncbi:MAG: AmmeMemoRadiSam system protein B [Spirochaetes bacterium RIFOXYC1_FULL_54_7]|nr:MAG: AmmeMemoRadiSam system protein B [Spirochaetes bacterium RIFOXYC1_FULL_54_7]